MSKSNESHEGRIEELERKLEELEELNQNPASRIGRGIAIAGMWFSAAVICFTPVIKEHFLEISLTVVGLTYYLWED